MDWIIGEIWKCPQKGLIKEVLGLKFSDVHKPNELSCCRVNICNVENLGDRPSFYLSQSQEIVMEMGTAVTPVDCYIESLTEQMLVGETSRCQILTHSGTPIVFEITLNMCSPTKYLFELSVEEVFNMAQAYRSKGVQMFKNYPRFAHDYFSRAAKCLMSFKPFDVLTKEENGVNGADLEMLLRALQTNIAACLLQEKRYEDVLYQTQFVQALSLDDIKKMEKAVYRRSVAFFNVKAYDEALALMEKVDGIQGKKEFATLYDQTKQMRKQDEDHYKMIVQRMFNKN